MKINWKALVRQINNFQRTAASQPTQNITLCAKNEPHPRVSFVFTLYRFLFCVCVLHPSPAPFPRVPLRRRRIQRRGHDGVGRRRRATEVDDITIVLLVRTVCKITKLFICLNWHFLLVICFVIVIKKKKRKKRITKKRI